MYLLFLSCFQNQQATEALRVCTQVLQLEPTNVNALKDRAEAYLLEDLYEEGTLVCILYISAVSISKFFNMRFDSALCCLFLSSTVVDLGKHVLLILS